MRKRITYKLLLIIRGDPEKTPSGTEIFVRNLANKLSKNGHTVHIFCSSNKEEIKKSGNTTFFKIKTINLPFLSTILFNFKARNKWHSIFKRENYDFIISFGIGGTTPIINLSKKNEITNIYYAVDTMIDEYSSKRNSLSLIERLNYKFKIYYDKMSCREANFVFCSCHRTSESLERKYNIEPNKMGILYFGIDDDFSKDLTRARKNLSKKKYDLLLIATDHIRKGSFFFIESLRFLKNNYQINPRSIIIGDYNAELMKQIKENSLNVSLVPKLPHEKLKDYFKWCRCLVVPSTSEGFCLPVIEAASFGVPSIVTNVGSLPELVIDGKTGYRVDRSIDKFSEKVSLMLTKKMWKKLGLEAKRHSKRFIISKIAQELEAFLFKLDIKKNE